MSAVPQILSVVRAKYGCVAPIPASEVAEQAAKAQEAGEAAKAGAPMVVVNAGVAFYRKYTEGLLRRYLRCSMEAGKVPSLMGKEMFRSKVSSYRMRSFEDIVIFMHDVEKCLGRLDEDQQQLIARITLQEYTWAETAELLGKSQRSIIRHYQDAIDRLTRIFLQVEMLEPKKLVQRQTQEDDE